MIRKIFARNIFLFVIVIVIFSVSMNSKECFDKRGRYLLGIAYNGGFLNANDNVVYEDYLKRHGSSPEIFQQGL